MIADDHSQHLIEELTSYEPYREFSKWLETFSSIPVKQPVAISKERMLQSPVDSYLILRKRLKDYGEVASFPEFASSVDSALKELNSDEIQKMAYDDPIFKVEVEAAIAEL